MVEMDVWRVRKGGGDIFDWGNKRIENGYKYWLIKVWMFVSFD